MKHRILVFKQKWQVPFHLGAAFMPAALLLGAYGIPEMPFLPCAIVGIYLVAALACILLPQKLRLAVGAVGIAGIVLSGFRMLTTFKSPALIFPPLLYAWLLIETLPLYGRDSREEMPPHVFVIGVVMHLAGQMMLFIAGRNESAVFDAVKPGLSWAFVLFFMLTLLNLNRANLIYVAAMEKTVPRHIYRFNRMLTIALVAVTIFLGCMPAVVRFIRWLWMSFIGLLADIVAWFFSLFPESEYVKPESGGGRENFLPAADSDPSLLAKILNILLHVLMFALVVLAIWMAIRYAKRFARWLWKRLKEYAAATSTGDYVDEITDTREDGERRRGRGRIKRRHDPLRGVNERKLAPAARIRFYYLRLLLRNKDWKGSDTARENLPEAAATLYERARYSRHEITETDAKSFKELTAGIGKN